MEEKTQFCLALSKDLKEQIREKYKKDNCSSISEYIEKAVRFYMGFTDAKNNIDFIPIWQEDPFL